MRELTSFKEDYPRLEKLGARVLAISSDSVASHLRFAAKLGGLPFPLLADTNQDVMRQYSVLNERGTAAVRSVFVVGRDGVLRHVNRKYNLSRPAHYTALLDLLKTLQ